MMSSNSSDETQSSDFRNDIFDKLLKGEMDFPDREKYKFTNIQSACVDQSGQIVFHIKFNYFFAEYDRIVTRCTVFKEELKVEQETQWGDTASFFDICISRNKLYVATENDIWEADKHTLEPVSEINIDHIENHRRWHMNLWGDDRYLLLSTNTSEELSIHKCIIYVHLDAKFISAIPMDKHVAILGRLVLYSNVLFAACDEAGIITGFKWIDDGLSIGDVVWGPVNTLTCPFFAISPSGSLVTVDLSEKHWVFYDTNELTQTTAPKSPIPSKRTAIRKARKSDHYPYVAFSEKLVFTSFGLESTE